MENNTHSLDSEESNPQEAKEETKEEASLDFQKLQQERDEYLAGWQRARADFLNYRKEEIERLGELFRHANEEFVLKLLPILDNLERAEREATDEERNSLVVQGCLLAISQLRDFFKKQGVESMEIKGKRFDPEFHEALGVQEGGESGFVAEELEKGYTIQGKLLRPAKVKIFQ